MERFIKKRFCIFGCLFIVYFYAPAFARADTIEQQEAANMLLNELIKEKKAPGLQYLFVDSDKVLYQFYDGFADLNQKTPVTETTTFNGYSITKTFTAAAVVKLAQAGKIDLDAPISRYLSDFPYKKSPTIRQTLQHTAGFPNPNPLAWIHRVEEHAKFDEQAFIHQVVNDNPRLDFDPGEKISYSNVGYLLLGEVVHQVSGKSYHEYVLNEIIKPLSLSKDNYIAYTIDDPANHALGYIRRWYWLNILLGWFIDRDKYLGQAVDGWVPFNHILINGNAYGGLIGNAGGFAIYLQAMLAAREPFNKEMIKLLWTTGSTNDGEPIRRGLAWFHGTLNGQSYFAHTGGAAGYYCEIRIYPDVNRASVVMTNNTSISNQRYLDRIDSVFLTEVDTHGS